MCCGCDKVIRCVGYGQGLSKFSCPVNAAFLSRESQIIAERNKVGPEPPKNWNSSTYHEDRVGMFGQLLCDRTCSFGMVETKLAALRFAISHDVAQTPYYHPLGSNMDIRRR